ncbi:MAG: MFS transporter [Desulfocapsaceae bacterium]|nr:MFS transporter [Desulfocapsaceae bacterium]
MRRTLQTNIYCLYLIKLSKWFMLIMPIVALYYHANGLTAADIYILQAVYSVSVAVLEIPSGYMADIIGRKKSLIAGAVLGTLGYFIYAISDGFSGFLIAEITLGLGGSFISGSDSAMLYDSLAGMRKQQRYLQLEGRITSLGNFAETIAAIGGGMIAAALSYRSVYVVQTAVAAMAVPAALLLIEPAREQIKSTPGFRHILAVCHESLLVNKQLSSTLLLSSLIGTCTLCMAWTAQVYFVHKGLTEAHITPLWVGLNLVVALVSAYASLVIAKMGRKAAIFSIICFIPASYILLGVLPLIPAIGILFIFYAIRGYATPLLKDMANVFCHSSTRATVLSIRNMIIRFGFAVLGPCIGALAAGFSLEYALITSGSVLLVLAGGATGYLFATGAGNAAKES